MFAAIFNSLFGSREKPEKSNDVIMRVEEQPKHIDEPEPESIASVKQKLAAVLKISDHQSIKAACKVVKVDVLPLLAKPATRRAIDDILTIELESLDCVDIERLPQPESVQFRHARREFASLCSLVDSFLPLEEAATKKKRNKRNKKKH